MKVLPKDRVPTIETAPTLKQPVAVAILTPETIQDLQDLHQKRLRPSLVRNSRPRKKKAQPPVVFAGHRHKHDVAANDFSVLYNRGMIFFFDSKQAAVICRLWHIRHNKEGGLFASAKEIALFKDHPAIEHGLIIEITGFESNIRPRDGSKYWRLRGSEPNGCPDCEDHK
jgi:hypothetical protein